LPHFEQKPPASGTGVLGVATIGAGGGGAIGGGAIGAAGGCTCGAADSVTGAAPATFVLHTVQNPDPVLISVPHFPQNAI
jgi:hypothetical protein